MIPKTIKKSLGSLGLLFGLTGLIPALAWSASPVVNTRSAVVINTSTGKTLFEYSADTRIPPASVTKVLTLYLVFEAIHEGRAHLTDRVLVSQKAGTTGGSRMYIQAGTTVSLEELIRGMAVDSGNDACVAAAEHLAGSEAAFVTRMNCKAGELGMTNSHFNNTNGLPSKGQFTTARDMAKLSLAYLHRFPEALHYHSMQTYTYNGVTQHNRNRLLGHCPGVDGIKTGWIAASGYNLLATAKRGDTRILVVALGAPNPAARLTETRKLLEVAFQKTAAGSSLIAEADLACYVDPYGPPPGKQKPHGKPKKTVMAKKSPPPKGKKAAKSSSQTTTAKTKTQQPAKTTVAKQKKPQVVASQTHSTKTAKVKQPAPAQQSPASKPPTKVAKHRPAQSGKPTTKTTKTANSAASTHDSKDMKKKADSHQTSAKSHKANGKAKDTSSNSKKKANPQAKKKSSEHS